MKDKLRIVRPMLICFVLAFGNIGCSSRYGSGFGNLGLTEIVMVVVVLFLVLGAGAFRRGSAGMRIAGPTLVLRQFKIDEAESANILVEIVGRVSGFTAWLLTVMGIDTETSLIVSPKEITIRRASLSGQAYSVVPFANVASTHCGYSKPFVYLVLGAVFALGGIFSAFGDGGGITVLLGLLIGGALLAGYWLSKTLGIAIETSGGIFLPLSFKRSVIENVSVELDQALKVIRIINEQATKAQH